MTNSQLRDLQAKLLADYHEFDPNLSIKQIKQELNKLGLYWFPSQRAWLKLSQVADSDKAE